MDGIGADALGVEQQLQSNEPLALAGGRQSAESWCATQCLDSSAAFYGRRQCIRRCVDNIVAQASNPWSPKGPPL